jgi:hypothetical protein
VTGAEIRALRTPLVLLLVAVIAGAAAVSYTSGLLESAATELAQQQTRLREAVSRLQKSGEEREIIVRHLEGYRQLQRTGFIGDEQRINWLDGLRLANQQTELFGVDYQINAQRPYPHAGEFDPGRLALYQSVMRLRFRLLHEEDLTRFFNALSARGRRRVRPRRVHAAAHRNQRGDPRRAAHLVGVRPLMDHCPGAPVEARP